MLTIDWKERLAKDTQDYLNNKLPNQDYDFDIIFNAYPERVNGKIPSEVISYVSGIIITKLGRDHEKYLPFFRYIWEKKGDHGRGAFITMMARLVPKKPAVYMPLLEQAMQRSNPTELASILERVVLPLLRKDPQSYLPTIYKWDRSPREEIRKANVNLLVKLMKRSRTAFPALSPTTPTSGCSRLGMPSLTMLLSSRPSTRSTRPGIWRCGTLTGISVTPRPWRFSALP